MKLRQSCRKYNSSKAGDSGTYQIKLRQSCRKYNSRKAGDCIVALRIACRRHMLPIKHKLPTTSTSLTHRTSRQCTTTQNQKYTGTHQIKLRQSCRKYNSSRAGDSVAPLRIACRRHMLPIKHKFHTTSKNHARYTSRQRSTTQN